MTVIKKMVVGAILILLCCGVTILAQAQSDGQKTFDSPQQAVSALIQAVRDGNNSELQAIFGPDSQQIVSSGDDVADKNARQSFVALYEAKHSLVKSGPNQLTLQVGKNDWPTPIPLVHGKKWYFDTAAGKLELVYRRIGKNELAAIDACRGVVSAQKDYRAESHEGAPAGVYAQKFLSDPGKQNGLYYQAGEGNTPSPAGPLLAQASMEGYSFEGSTKAAPYHGYYYRIISAQGAAAPGGARSYIVDGKMTGGFALVAYPAEYRTSGVMTFIVNQSGAIYQKDLGDSTADVAKAMTEYNPDKTWTLVK